MSMHLQARGQAGGTAAVRPVPCEQAGVKAAKPAWRYASSCATYLATFVRERSTEDSGVKTSVTCRVRDFFKVQKLCSHQPFLQEEVLPQSSTRKAWAVMLTLHSKEEVLLLTHEVRGTIE